MSKLDNYIELVERLASERSSERVYNTGKEHCIILTSTLIRESEGCLNILCKNMDREITENPKYLEAMKVFLEKDNSEVKILMTHFHENESAFLDGKIVELFKKYDTKKYKIKHIKDYNNIISIKGKPINFMVDKTKFRFETDVEKYMAFGSFNDEKMAYELNKSFSALFNAKVVEVIGL